MATRVLSFGGYARACRENAGLSIRAVNKALGGKPPTPTPTVTATQTVAYTPPPPAGYSVIYRFAGRGEKQTEPFTIRANATRWRICYRFTGDTNAVIYLLDGNGEQMELLLNEIGAYADCTTRFEPVGQRYALQLKGNYTITVEETFDP